MHNESDEQQTFTVPSTYPRLSVSDCLRRLGVSSTLRRRVKYHGRVSINGIDCSWPAFVEPGDTITIAWKTESNLQPEDIPLHIVYEDEWLLVINKPPGMLVHPTTTQSTGTLANAVVHYYRQQYLSHGFHPVQRLDRNTSGLLVIAKLSSIHHQLSHRHLRRIYLAVVEGIPSPATGTIDLPIARHPDSIIVRKVCLSGQSATTHYTVLKSFSGASLLKLELMTGRTHQIRVHMSHIGHPLIGDDLYGGGTALLQRQALHSFSLEFTHPISGKLISLSAALPQDMNILLQQFANDATFEIHL